MLNLNRKRTNGMMMPWLDKSTSESDWVEFKKAVFQYENSLATSEVKLPIEHMVSEEVKKTVETWRDKAPDEEQYVYTREVLFKVMDNLLLAQDKNQALERLKGLKMKGSKIVDLVRYMSSWDEFMIVLRSTGAKEDVKEESLTKSFIAGLEPEELRKEARLENLKTLASATTFAVERLKQIYLHKGAVDRWFYNTGNKESASREDGSEADEPQAKRFKPPQSKPHPPKHNDVLKGKECLRCGKKEGHGASKRCDAICAFCGAEGHGEMKCFKKPKEDSSSNNATPKGGKNTNPNVDTKGKPPYKKKENLIKEEKICYKCKEAGHIQRDCPKN